MNLIEGRDAAYASNIGAWNGIVGGYLNSPNAYHPWPAGDWTNYRVNRKLPYWVCNFTEKNGEADGHTIVNQLRALGVPEGCPVAVDMETEVDRTYLGNLFRIVRMDAGYKVLVYGSANTIFGNPSLNGYIVAQYDGKPEIDMTWPRSVRGKQYMSGPYYDSNVFKSWTTQEMWQ